MPSEDIRFNISKTALLVPQLEGLCGGPAVHRGFSCAFTTYCVNYQLTTPPPTQQTLSFSLYKVLHTTASVFVAAAVFSRLHVFCRMQAVFVVVDVLRSVCS